MGISVFDFGELFTLSVRPIIGAASKRGFSFYFDYPAGPTYIQGDAQAFQRSIYRMVSAASRTIQSGSLILAADATVGAEPGQVDLQINAASSGERSSGAALDQMLDDLGMAREGTWVDGVEIVSARGTCPILGAELHYRCVPSAGTLLGFQLQQPGEVRNDVTPPNARGATAIVLHDQQVSVQGLNRRLLRLGWQVQLFTDETAFCQAVAREDDQCRLVVVVESTRLDLDELHRLSARLDLPAANDERMHVYAVRLGSEAVGIQAPVGWALHSVPFLPSEIWDFTRRADPEAEQVHEHSRPTPLPSSKRPRVLVVDDDEVNRVIASGLLQMIGYEAVSAASGDEAIEMCQRGAPDAVLMDINMPGLDGYDTTDALKHLQRRGGIPPFPIIAATAAGTPARSLERGLDGHLSKPLLAEELRTQLSRALRGLATGL